MIKSVELNGFKSFVSDTIEFGNLTLLTGLNSSGKSSIMQSILLLQKASKNEPIYLEGHGNILECQNPYSKDGIHIVGEFSDKKTIEIHNDKVLEKNHTPLLHLNYISANRFGPETQIPINIGSSEIGYRGENILQCIEEKADNPLNEILRHENSEGETLLFNLKAWLGVISPNVKFDHKISTISDSSYTTFNGHRAKNVGFGLSYSLPVITALLLGSTVPGSIVMIENPEAHLHPRGQTEMAKLICLCVEAGVQVIVETHSDHLFDGIRLYSKSNMKNFHENIKGYWFELDKNNNTQVEAVLIDKNGRVKNWPKGMFDQFEINASKLL